MRAWRPLIPIWDTRSQKLIIDIEVISDQITDFIHLKDLNFHSFKITVGKIWENLVSIKKCCPVHLLQHWIYISISIKDGHIGVKIGLNNR